MDKVEVKGENAIPLYKWLNEDDKFISWNFHKFLIDREGNCVGSFKPKGFYCTQFFFFFLLSSHFGLLLQCHHFKWSRIS